MKQVSWQRRKGEIAYNVVNIAVLLCTAVFFLSSYKDCFQYCCVYPFWSILLLAASVPLVHAVKAARLYLALYGSKISLSRYLATYCKVTSVSVVLPLKLGDYFRMLCYGHEMKNTSKGIVVVVLDRFMDTIGLLTIIFLVKLWEGSRIPTFAYLLLIFFCMAIVVYVVFPGIAGFWKEYLLSTKASARTLSLLKGLTACKTLHVEIGQILRGGGFLMYSLSLVAWVIEIFTMTLLRGTIGEGISLAFLSDYLTSAVGGQQVVELKLFVFTSVIFGVALYIVMKIGLLLANRGRA